ncbi:MAG: hypothetical protein AMJ90_05165 [candidate division Zixibacteria bacterium SM23_73_2]|nr:MAG: hypothetical protein AMJ90_05165 [candidate division Zixibacteria bacterium SM23_73_2]
MKDKPRVYYITQFITAIFWGSVIPVYVLYFRHFDLNLFQVAFMAAIFESSILIFELPTGLVADIYGRRISLLLSALVLFFGGLVFIKFPTFFGFIIAEITVGVGYTLKSGAFEAWIFDSLKHEGKEKDAKEVFSQGKRYQTAGELLGMILGGYIGFWSINFVWYPFAFGSLATFVFLFLAMREEYWEKAKEKIKVFKQIKDTIQKSLEVVRQKKLILALVVLGIFSSFSFETISQFWQVHFSENLSVATSYFGWIVAGSSLLVILLVNKVSKFSEFFKKETTLLLILKIGFFISFLIIAFTYNPILTIIFFILLHGFEGFSAPIFLDIFNRHIPSEQRATLLSFQSMTGSGGEVLAGLFMGFFALNFGLRPTFGLGSLVMIIGVLVFFALILQNKKL